MGKESYMSAPQDDLEVWRIYLFTSAVITIIEIAAHPSVTFGCAHRECSKSNEIWVKALIKRKCAKTGRLAETIDSPEIESQQDNVALTRTDREIVTVMHYNIVF